MRSSMRWLAIGSLALAASACSDTLGVEDIVGLWQTQSVNGDPVPGDVQTNDGSIWYVEWERLTLAEAGTCSFSQRVEGTNYDIDCHYDADLDEQTIVVTLHVDHLGTFDGDTMTLTDNEGNVRILRRE